MIGRLISFLQGKRESRSKILLIENRFEDLEELKQILSQRYIVSISQNKEDALEKAQNDKPDMVILNRKLNKESTLSLCLALRLLKETMNVPILVITEKGEESNIVEFYIHKIEGLIFEPFVKNDILSQIQTVFLDRSNS